ncbi:hypothetical protein KFE96_06640 [Kordiimonas sp. SCSIO 12603]|uniref:hypothetical protein n=1 Tax=Kordiimonas sp. SCSIO 12603 TaxID=2829596 RepID=UPI0021073D7B|nr:hypothetical protein [Kordiimonas sp. SCSIO 12603]UTW59978.1 hypothetical protein KFE96_06640 [Kordiimonas sp. SCSIO 12603]
MSDHTATHTQNPEINPKQAAVILQLLQRTQMQGAEMPAYVDVFNTLSAIVATAPQEMAENQAGA